MIHHIESAVALSVSSARRFCGSVSAVGEMVERVLNQPVVPDASEIAWHAWLTPVELRAAVHDTTFVPDARDAFDRYQAEKAGPCGPLPRRSALPPRTECPL
ncbi:NUDIX hydrolase [Streptomyces olivochromogenes]|uniref:hypothetical protein n=1 Tax=Streptomyces olivochromogenes TaxID=1963 RepID=UPI0036D0688D